MTAAAACLTYPDVDLIPQPPTSDTLTRRLVRSAWPEAAPAPVRVSGAASRNAVWLQSVAVRLRRLITLPPNWNSYGGLPVSPFAAGTAISMLYDLLRDSDPAPTIVPTSRGGVQIEWHTLSKDLEIEIAPSGDTRIYYSNEDDDFEWEGNRRDCPFSLLEVIREFVAGA